MKYELCSAILAALLLLPMTALARENNSHSVVFANKVTVAGQQLKPGTYKVEWQQTGPHVKVNFIQNDKTVATAPATLKTNDAQVTQDDVQTKTTASHKNALMEIDFAHQKEALLFSPQKS